MPNLEDLYQQDYQLWLQGQVKAIVNQDISSMDLDNLLIEIEGMGASQKRALRSYYYKLVEHILKLIYWQSEKEHNQIKWRIEITNLRTFINDILLDSPSLNNYLTANHAQWFDKVANNYLENQLFPLKDPEVIALERMMDEDFFG